MRRAPAAIVACIIAGVLCFDVVSRAQVRIDVESLFHSIDAITSALKLPRLRTLKKKADDLEFRIWVGGFQMYRGYSISRSSGRWSARAMVQTGERSAKFAAVPKSTDWATVWAELEREGVLAIKGDSEQPPPCDVVLDGVVYTVEVARADFYRAYEVSNPDADVERSENGDHFIRLLPILHRAFGDDRLAAPALAPQGEQLMSWISREDVAIRSRRLATLYCHDWPSIALQGKLRGDVVVEVTVEPDGHVSAARSLSGNPVFRPPTERVALTWLFEPIAAGGQRMGELTVTYGRKVAPYSWMMAPRRGRQ